MLKDEQGNYFSKSKIQGSQKQLAITLPRRDWNHYPVGTQVKVFNKDKSSCFDSRITSMGSGRQRNVNVPQEMQGVMSVGEVVRIYLKVSEVSNG